MGLTVKQVQNAKPGRLSDGGGLYLLVKPSGTKSWVLRVQLDGRRRDWGLGAATTEPLRSDLPVHLRSTLTLAEAREKARLGRELAKAGRDPSKEWRSQDRDAEVVRTFKSVAEQHHRELKPSWRNKKHAAQWLTTLETYAFPQIGSRSLDEIDAHSLQEILLPIWLKKPETARRLKQRMISVLDYGHAKGWRDREAPKGALGQLLRGIKQPQGSNFPAIDHRALPAFAGALRRADPTVGRLALQFLMFTVCRSGEVRGATWSEVDLESGEWVIPGERMKRGKTHRVPLTPPARAILKFLAMRFPTGPGDLLFPGMRGKVLSAATLSKALRGTNGGAKATVHGLRSTFTDWAADENFPDAWVEAALAHRIPDKTQAAYRRTTYFDQRRDKLMPAWTDYALSEGEGSIPLASNSPESEL